MTDRARPNGQQRHRRSDDAVPVGEVLETYLDYLGAPPVRTLTTLEARWSELVGPALAEPTRPIELVDGVLVVGCSDATWASQVGWMETQIKERFEALFDGAQIRRIQTRIDR